MRSPRYLQWIREQPCVCCGGPAQAHHLIGHGSGYMGGKSSDFAAIPLCHRHHVGDEGIHQLGVKTWEREWGDQRAMLAMVLLRAVMEKMLIVRCYGH